ncbi:type I restriction enzyme endonuclease domain-containing protein [Endozoicomonas sp. GU-1]|uniref:type I restriction enzyme endonuclease domain-containing protein n=1 Tax=Endozoicomonas sp. GU-1 TaxID=3009078 RepID=UPI0022B3F6D8|nr:type I restriction enzyme endonuclease domain-containing protein [Endozoicomonas sp. GU-1]WBA79755.1 DUF3387 domain-containing protein [Endozoicomonas sp. GU-1]WBA87338.1 DUF3387 domain-containing protein [Endozoicomonas sp. GU-1]
MRSIIFKLTHGTASDTALMNARVKEMLAEAIKSDGVEKIFKPGEDSTTEIDLFDDDYLERIDKIKLPNTKIQLLKKLLAKALSEFKKTNKVKAVDFLQTVPVPGGKIQRAQGRGFLYHRCAR